MTTTTARQLVMITTLLLTSPLPSHATVETCRRLESARQLIHQQLRDSKTCSESNFAKGWTDCTFRSGGTVVRLVGAIGTEPAVRFGGILGSGFWVDSVDRRHTLR